jgi:hypothetical protein
MCSNSKEAVKEDTLPAAEAAKHRLRRGSVDDEREVLNKSLDVGPYPPVLLVSVSGDEGNVFELSLALTF